MVDIYWGMQGIQYGTLHRNVRSPRLFLSTWRSFGIIWNSLPVGQRSRIVDLWGFQFQGAEFQSFIEAMKFYLISLLSASICRCIVSLYCFPNGNSLKFDCWATWLFYSLLKLSSGKVGQLARRRHRNFRFERSTDSLIINFSNNQLS